jgi:hypothetical protein
VNLSHRWYDFLTGGNAAAFDAGFRGHFTRFARVRSRRREPVGLSLSPGFCRLRILSSLIKRRQNCFVFESPAGTVEIVDCPALLVQSQLMHSLQYRIGHRPLRLIAERDNHLVCITESRSIGSC